MRTMNPITLSCMFVLMAVCGVSMGAVYKVGDSAGWTNNGSVDYKSWSSSKTFQVGDTIVFEYKPLSDNVLRVTHKNFMSCNMTAPFYNLSSGMDSVSLKKKTHFYFISGFPGHCLSGQKVDIRVTAAAPHQPPSQSPLYEPLSPAPSPSQHKNNDAFSISFSSFLVFSMVLVASVFVY